MLTRKLAGPLLMLAAGPAFAVEPISADAQSDSQKVIEGITRSKTTTAVYANYMWNRITLPRMNPMEEWSAEFHSGSKHRVETPRDRVIADCAAMTGSALSLQSGEVKTGRAVAAGACGISTENAFASARHLGRVDSRFGTADRIELSDKDTVRTYDISDEGVLLRTVYANNDAARTPLIENWSVAIEHSLPPEDIFNEASLTRSAVPERFQAAPAN